MLCFARTASQILALNQSETKDKKVNATRLFAQLICSTSSQQQHAHKPTVLPQHCQHCQQNSKITFQATKDLLIQINRKPIIMVPPIRIPREPKLPIHIRDLFLEASFLPK
jgi:hypothetical protein